MKIKKNKSEFAVITNLLTGEIELFEQQIPINKRLEKYSKQINEFFKNKKMELLMVQIYSLRRLKNQEK